MYYIPAYVPIKGRTAMGKYSALGDYLRARTRSEVPMTFAQIERVIGAKLPESHKYRAWWSNNAFNSVMTKTWLEAGFRTERVDMARGKLVFRRVNSLQEPAGFSEGEVGAASFQGRRGASSRHPLFGFLRGSIRILPGTDLTQPADPEWGKDA
jgi:hypothetical protein